MMKKTVKSLFSLTLAFLLCCTLFSIFHPLKEKLWATESHAPASNGEVIQTRISHKKVSGDSNYFTFSEGWEAGNNEHVWSQNPSSKTDPTSIWYEVKFVGHKIDVYAGKNRPMGKVKYYIDGVEQGTYNLWNNGNISSTLIASFDGLEEREHTFRAVATGQKESGNSNTNQTLIDAAHVIVHHTPYQVADIVLPQERLSMVVGQEMGLSYRLLPDYAGTQDLRFEIDHPEIVSVEQGVVRAKKAGDTVIRIKYGENLEKPLPVSVTRTAPQLFATQVNGDFQYTQSKYEALKETRVQEASLSAWKNSFARATAVLYSKNSTVENIRLQTQAVEGPQTLPATAVEARFIRSTLAYRGNYLGYGDPNRPLPNGNREEASDILSRTESVSLGFNQLQPISVKIHIPKNAPAGTYRTRVKIVADELTEEVFLDYVIEVKDAVLPDVSEFRNLFDVEFWQYPYRVAEYYQVEPFSEAHFAVLAPLVEKYKSLGATSVTTTMNEDAWNGQTYAKSSIKYPSMIRWEKQADGSFRYDFTHFDRYVQFYRERGVGKKIVIYSIAPWHNAFTYWENGNLVKEPYVVNSDRYRKVYGDFLRSLITHLMEKGWFDDAYIGIDERGFHKAAFDLIDSVRNIHDKPLKTTGAMDGFVTKKDLALRVTDLTVGDTAAQAHPEEFKQLLAERKAKGYKTTLYSCTEHVPGNYVLSQPVESYWTVLAAGRHTQGFLRWAYDAWVENPLQDATHNAFEPGDSFLVYPEAVGTVNPQVQSSLRLERMEEALHDVIKWKQMLKEIPHLKTDVEAMYAKIQTVATTRQSLRGNSYLSEEFSSLLSEEMQTFKRDLDALTDKYIALKAAGTNQLQSLQIVDDFDSVYMGRKAVLRLQFEPQNVLNTAVEWTSSRPNILSVDADGVLQAHKLGTATITATSLLDRSKKASKTITVTRLEVSPEGRVAYYSFDESNARDAWQERHGTENQVTYEQGKEGLAARLTETQNITFPSNTELTDEAFTISYWVKSSELPKARASVMMDANKDFSYDLKMASDRPAGIHVGKSSGSVLTYKYNFEADKWYYVSFVQDKRKGLAMYVNGQLVENNAWTKNNRIKPAIDIFGGTGFDGYLDEVKIYRRALTEEEIRSDMLTSGLNLSEKNKTLYIDETYQIDTSLITTASDKTIHYSSLNPDIATVNEEGLVTAKTVGETDIVVENRGGNYRETVKIKVKKYLYIKNTLPTYRLQDKYVTDIEKKPNTDRQYLGQPDMVRTEKGRLITAYPKGHGKGPVIMQISDDEGETWTEKMNKPLSWEGSQETPTLYRVTVKGKERLMMINANPGWGRDSAGIQHGWNTSYSDDNGETWTEYRNWYPVLPHNQRPNEAIVAMASLVQLKDEQGNLIEKWLGVYHNYQYVNFKTYLTFDEQGNEQWTAPEPYLAEHREIEDAYDICEVGLFRSPDGKRIVGLARSQSHNNPATLIYSEDEGTTWSKPMDLPGSLAGERHKAVYDPISQRLLITFREIVYDMNNNNLFDGDPDWRAGEWVAWVGSYEDLIKQNEGDYRILLREDFANNRKSGDTGYAGIVALEDGTFVLVSYGHFDKEFSSTWAQGVTTDLSYIKRAKFKIGEVENDEGLVHYEKLSEIVQALHKTDVHSYANEPSLMEKLKTDLQKAEKFLTGRYAQQSEVDALLQSLKDIQSRLTKNIFISLDEAPAESLAPTVTKPKENSQTGTSSLRSMPQGERRRRSLSTPSIENTALSAQTTEKGNENIEIFDKDKKASLVLAENKLDQETSEWVLVIEEKEALKEEKLLENKEHSVLSLSVLHANTQEVVALPQGKYAVKLSKQAGRMLESLYVVNNDGSLEAIAFEQNQDSVWVNIEPEKTLVLVYPAQTPSESHTDTPLSSEQEIQELSVGEYKMLWFGITLTVLATITYLAWILLMKKEKRQD